MVEFFPVGVDVRLCWAYFASPCDEVEADPVLCEEMKETLNELFSHLEGSFPGGVVLPGRNPDIDCIRLTLDPINSEHRPLAFYLVRSFILKLIVGCLLAPSSYLGTFSI